MQAACLDSGFDGIRFPDMKQPGIEQRHLRGLRIERYIDPQREFLPRLRDRARTVGFRDEAQQLRNMVLYCAAEPTPRQDLRRLRLGSRPATYFVFFTAATGAAFVSPDFHARYFISGRRQRPRLKFATLYSLMTRLNFVKPIEVRGDEAVRKARPTELFEESAMAAVARAHD